MKDPGRFYKELGNVFYAIAAADKNIRKEEREKLNDEIRFAWKHFDNETDRFGTDRAWLIEFEFELLEDSMVPADKAFDLFCDYFKENGSMIDQHTRIRIFNSARHIAESIRKINIEELEYLVKLKQLMAI